MNAPANPFVPPARSYVPALAIPGSRFERIKLRYFQRIVMPAIHAAGYERAFQVAERLGRFLYDNVPSARRAVLLPLRDALEQTHSGAAIDAIARECVAHAISSHVVIAYIDRRVRPGTWERCVRMIDSKPLADAMHAGRGVVVAAADHGENEVGMTAAGHYFGGRVAAIVGPVQSSIHQRWMADLVRRRVATLYPRVGALTHSENALSSGRMLFVIAHHVGRRGRGVTLRFLGRRQTFYPSAAMLAARAHCPLAVVTCTRTEGPYRFEMRVREFLDPPPDASLEWVHDATRRTLGALEAGILERPSQFLWFRQPPEQAE